MEQAQKEKAHQELEKLKLYYDTVLSTLEPGVLVLDAEDKVITENDKVTRLWEFSGKMVGRKLQDTEMWSRCPELKQHLEDSRRDGPKTVRFDCYAGGSTMNNRHH